MSYKSIEMWTVVCDEPGCGEVFEDEDADFVAWTDKDSADEIAFASDWYVDAGKHFCPDHTPVAAAYEDGVVVGERRRRAGMGCRAPGEQTTCHLGLAHCHRAEAAEAEVQRLTAALTERDRRIEAALERLQWAACTVRGCKIPACSGAHDASALLRGESDE